MDSNLGQIVPIGPPSAGELAAIEALAEKASQYAHEASAFNTRRAYQSDWSDFERWCASVGTSTLPAAPASVALYLTALARTHSVSTLSRRLAAIRAFHRDADLPSPNSGALTAVWAGIRRCHGRPPESKRPLLVQDLRLAVSKLPETLRGRRDRAILLLGFAGALRRSELAAVELPGGLDSPVIVRSVAEGLELHIRRSKSDQEGQGVTIGVPRGRCPETCPVAAVAAWCEAAGIADGALFRKISRSGRVGTEPLGPQTIAQVVKAAASSIGHDPNAFAGHSLRSGLATSAAANDAPSLVIQRHLRHAQSDTTARYIQSAERFSKNASGFAGL